MGPVDHEPAIDNRPRHQYYNPEDLPERFDKTSDLLWLQRDIVSRLRKRACGWTGCHSTLASEAHLLQHLKKRDHAREGQLVKRHPLEKDAFQCRWTGCPTPLYRSRRKLLQHMVAAHVSKELHCPFREVDFRSGPCFKTCPTLSSIERHVNRAHRDAVERTLLPMSTFDGDTHNPPPRSISEIPASVPSTDVLPYVSFPSVWITEARKYNAILAVQDNCFIDREEPRMSCGRSPQSMAIPKALPVVMDEQGEEAGIPVAPGAESLVEGQIVDVEMGGATDLNIANGTTAEATSGSESGVGDSSRYRTPPPNGGSRGCYRMEVSVEVPSPLKIVKEVPGKTLLVPLSGPAKRLARRAAIKPQGKLFRGMRIVGNRTAAGFMTGEEEESAFSGTLQAGAGAQRALKRKMGSAFEVEIPLERGFFSRRGGGD